MYLTANTWDKDRYEWMSTDMSDYDQYLVITQKEFALSVELPENLDLNGMEVASLEKQKEKVNTQAFMEMKVIDEKIQSLKAIGHDNE